MHSTVGPGRTNGSCVEGSEDKAHCRQLPIGTGVVAEGRIGDCVRVVEPLRNLRQHMPADVDTLRGATPSGIVSTQSSRPT